MRWAAGAVVLLALALPAAAHAKSFTLPQARVDVRVQRDGALKVREFITYQFLGPFSGGYREIPLRKGEQITQISVTEGGRRYRPGASAELGSSGAPDTYGTKDLDARSASSGTTPRCRTAARSCSATRCPG